MVTFAPRVVTSRLPYLDLWSCGCQLTARYERAIKDLVNACVDALLPGKLLHVLFLFRRGRGQEGERNNNLRALEKT